MDTKQDMWSKPYIDTGGGDICMITVGKQPIFLFPVLTCPCCLFVLVRDSVQAQRRVGRRGDARSGLR